jgi:SHS2 domain-containing protein
MEPTRRFEVLSHTADTGIIAYGSTLPELFEHAAYGMFSLMFDLGEGASPVSRSLVAAGDTVEELLVAWLGETLAVAEIEDLAFSSFTVDRLEEGGVQGAAAGSPAEEAVLIGPPIKAVTFHDLAVVEIPDGWWARIIFDV